MLSTEDRGLHWTPRGTNETVGEEREHYAILSEGAEDRGTMKKPKGGLTSQSLCTWSKHQGSCLIGHRTHLWKWQPWEPQSEWRLGTPRRSDRDWWGKTAVFSAWALSSPWKTKENKRRRDKRNA